MNNKKEQAIALIFSIVGGAAILANLTIKGFSVENLLDAVKDLVGLLVTVAIFFVAYAMSRKTKSYLEVARQSLLNLQKKHFDFLLGPRYNRENYDPEKGKGLEYLFVRNSDLKSKQRVKLVPVQPLEEGVLMLYVQKGTLVYVLNYASDEATPEEIQKIRNKVKDAVIGFANEKYAGKYEEIETRPENCAIMIDFDENTMGKRKFAKAITECTDIAVTVLKSFRK